jgi:hypothetical protein
LHSPGENALTHCPITLMRRSMPLLIIISHRTYSSQETCLVLQGRVTVTPEGGAPVEIKAGDMAIFPAGMKCTWEVSRMFLRFCVCVISRARIIPCIQTRYDHDDIAECAEETRKFLKHLSVGARVHRKALQLRIGATRRRISCQLLRFR